MAGLVLFWVSGCQWICTHCTCDTVVPRFAGGVILGCHRGGQCRQGSESVQILLVVLLFRGVGIAVGAGFGWAVRGSALAVDVLPTSLVKQHVPAFRGVNWGLHWGGQ